MQSIKQTIPKLLDALLWCQYFRKGHTQGNLFMHGFDDKSDYHYFKWASLSYAKVNLPPKKRNTDKETAWISCLNTVLILGVPSALTYLCIVEEKKKIILFDGVCNLCNGFIQFVIKHDKNDKFRYAALQSDVGQQLIAERKINTEQIDSVILIEPGVAYYVKSDAALQVGRHLKGFHTMSKVMNLIPRGLRNIIYDFIARYRYAWFGKKQACMIPTPELKAKFLD